MKNKEFQKKMAAAEAEFKCSIKPAESVDLGLSEGRANKVWYPKGRLAEVTFGDKKVIVGISSGAKGTLSDKEGFTVEEFKDGLSTETLKTDSDLASKEYNLEIREQSQIMAYLESNKKTIVVLNYETVSDAILAVSDMFNELVLETVPADEILKPTEEKPAKEAAKPKKAEPKPEPKPEPVPEKKAEEKIEPRYDLLPLDLVMLFKETVPKDSFLSYIDQFKKKGDPQLLIYAAKAAASETGLEDKELIDLWAVCYANVPEPKMLNEYVNDILKAYFSGKPGEILFPCVRGAEVCLTYPEKNNYLK